MTITSKYSADLKLMIINELKSSRSTQTINKYSLLTNTINMEVFNIVFDGVKETER